MEPSTLDFMLQLLSNRSPSETGASSREGGNRLFDSVLAARENSPLEAL